MPGDLVKREGNAFWVGGHFVGIAKPISKAGVPLEAAQAGLIAPGEYFVATPSPDSLDESHPLDGVYKFKVGFGGEMADFLGCLDLPVKRVRAGLWNRLEPAYYRLHQRLKGDIYY